MHWRSRIVPNDIEDQIATYFSWVETRAGFPLRGDAPDLAANEHLPSDEALVIELHASTDRRSRLRFAAIGLVAAAVIIGVVLIADRPTAQPRRPANSVVPTDSRAAEAESAKRLAEREAAVRTAVAQLAAAEQARKAAEATKITAVSTNTPVNPATAVPADEATYLTADGPVPALAGLAGVSIFDMKMMDATSGWAITSGVLAHTDDRGATWRSQTIPPPSNSRGSGKSFMLDSDHAWVVRAGGGDSVVVTGSDDGAATSTATTIDPGFSDGMPSGVVFVDRLNGFVSIVDPATQSANLTGRATLYRTVDGGRTFELVNADSPVPLAFIDSQTGWASGEGLFLTTDAGATWTRVKPPLWDSAGPDPNGPSYQIITTSPGLTVVKVIAPTGLEAQVVYVATDDQGKTWRDVAPPDTSEVNNTGPQSMLTAVSTTHWFGIQQTGGSDATMWTTTDGGATYHSTHLPFPALTISMSTPSVGWSSTASDIRSTLDGGATWTKIADVIPPAEISDGCTWQPSFDTHDGAAQHEQTVIRLTNTSATDCAPPPVSGITSDAPDGVGTITATQGGFFPVGALPSRVAPGNDVVIALTTANALETCNNPSTRPVTTLIIGFGNRGDSSVTLDHPIESACEFAYVVGGDG
jgi:hypothetical protein